MEVLLKGRMAFISTADLQFNINQADAFELLEGANIYKNKLAFVRELYQNALDATKIRLWQDLNDGYYLNCIQNWVPGEELLPYHFSDLSFLNDYKIIIDINYDDSTEMVRNENSILHFSIKDRGTGISDDDLKKMVNTGKSWCKRAHWDKLIKSMPRWLRPTGNFGIGLQSVFSVTDTLKAYTGLSPRG